MGFGLRSWRVLGASVEGSGHRRSGTGCQDAHAWSVAGGTLVAAVADGAGSARRAADGARIAARFSVEYCTWRLYEPADGGRLELLTDVLIATRRKLVRTATADGCDVGDLATTLALVIADSHGVWAAQVGDGSVVVGQPGGSFVVMAEGERQEYLNETTFLTSRTWAAACHLEEATSPVESIALLTDGLGLLALDLADGGRPHAPFFEPLLGFARADEACSSELERFLGSERVATRTDDDVTLLLATRS